jgi:hypothetical protein
VTIFTGKVGIKSLTDTGCGTDYEPFFFCETGGILTIYKLNIVEDGKKKKEIFPK